MRQGAMKNDKGMDMQFTPDQILDVKRAADMAEELVVNFYKMSSSRWSRLRFDIVTLKDLSDEETVSGPFAQVVRYGVKEKDSVLGSSSYDFYKICIQDHSVNEVLAGNSNLKLFPLSLYIVVHELVHIVRFALFVQQFEASEDEKLEEESRVHELTHDILASVEIPGMDRVFSFYEKWINKNKMD